MRALPRVGSGELAGRRPGENETGRDWAGGEPETVSSLLVMAGAALRLAFRSSPHRRARSTGPASTRVPSLLAEVSRNRFPATLFCILAHSFWIPVHVWIPGRISQSLHGIDSFTSRLLAAAGIQQFLAAAEAHQEILFSVAAPREEGERHVRLVSSSGEHVAHGSQHLQSASDSSRS